MAEHEMVKRAENIADEIQHSGKPFFKKVIKILLEILIIVFAISFSLYLEHLRETSHDRQLEKDFLVSLRSDLKNKLEEFSADSANYSHIKNSWHYLYSVSINTTLPDKDSIDNAALSFNFILLLSPDNSLFESIKSSGKLYVIRNKKLFQKILALYQEDIPSLLKSIENIYYPLKKDLGDILAANRNKASKKDNLSDLLQKNDALSNRLSQYYEVGIVVGFYGTVISDSKQIIEMINTEIPE